MSNSNAHDHYPLPVMTVGGGRGRLKGGQHVMTEDHTPMTNLLADDARESRRAGRDARRQHRHDLRDLRARTRVHEVIACTPLASCCSSRPPRPRCRRLRSRMPRRRALVQALKTGDRGDGADARAPENFRARRRSRRHDGAALGGAARRSRARRAAASVGRGCNGGEPLRRDAAAARSNQRQSDDARTPADGRRATRTRSARTARRR